MRARMRVRQYRAPNAPTLLPRQGGGVRATRGRRSSSTCPLLERDPICQPVDGDGSNPKCGKVATGAFVEVDENVIWSGQSSGVASPSRAPAEFGPRLQAIVDVSVAPV